MNPAASSMRLMKRFPQEDMVFVSGLSWFFVDGETAGAGHMDQGRFPSLPFWSHQTPDGEKAFAES